MLPWALLFFAAALAGCADQGAPGADDPFAPVITATSPTDGQAGVSTATVVSVTFSEAMDTAAVEQAFALSPLADGAFSWDAGETAIVFAPAAQLAPDTSYTATMGADAADLAGNLLGSAFSFSFATAAAPDLSAPTVLGVVPTAGAVNVGSSTAVTITFSETMNPASVESAFSLAPSSGQDPALVGTFAWSQANSVLAFSPDGPLLYATEYTVTIGSGAADLAGTTLAAPYAFPLPPVPS